MTLSAPTDSTPTDAPPTPEGAFVPSQQLPARTRVGETLRDWRRSVEMWDLWSTLGWYDIRHRYRRSTLGPFWITLSMAVFVGSLGFLYAGLFRLPIAEYMPYLACGFLAWSLIGSAIEEGCSVFINASATITQVRTPLYVHVLRTIWKNLLIFVHNAAVPIVVLLAFGMFPGLVGLLALVGVALILANALWVSGLLALICARFRDVPQIVTSLLPMMFLMTPVIWKKELLQDRAAFAEYNPLYHFVELVRRPLLGDPPELISYGVAVGFCLAGWTLTLAFYQRYRTRVPFWL